MKDKQRAGCAGWKKPALEIDILTIFPAMFTGPLTESLLGKARDKGILDIRIHDIRSFAVDKHHCVDDRPFGGGHGMVMKPDVLYAALKSVGAVKRTRGAKPGSRSPLVVYLSPQGTPLAQGVVQELASYRRMVLICGHYEGIDERVMEWVDREISIGDYVVTGGELPAMVLIDAVSRLIPGVVKESGSVESDSFFNGLLDYPHYTRPAVFRKRSVPDVLLSGNHANVEKWRRRQSLTRTEERRPDLLEKAALTPADKKLLSGQ